MEMWMQGQCVYAELLADTELQAVIPVDTRLLTAHLHHLPWRKAVSEKHRQT
jgi:hypothetical protein